MTLDKNFDPAAIEACWYAHWESTGQFRPERGDAQPFTIVNPPPNVTGSLHIGHALDNTLQDIIIRHERLKGKDALWVVGTDHAGIATQMVVERQMEAAGDKRSNYSRDEFIEKVWEWKTESGGTITGQLRRLGCSMDWSNERFTMDEGFTKAVTKVFVDLYNEGLIYRDKRLVNWDPALKTAISDLEVENREMNGHFWHFSYPLADGSGAISVATTRPETMLADMAVAVHPDDERYAALVGKMVKLPITGRLITIITDEHADPELGSGAVKITPGHDFNDFEVGKRAGFAAGDMLNMLDAEAKVVQCGDIPDELIGLDRFEARKKVVALIDAEGLLEKIEERVIVTPYGDRGGVVIEPWLTDQWYVDAKTLAQPAIEAVKTGAIEIVPKSWEKTYFNWMENIQPWCVSRQLWWGHRIPVCYGPESMDGGDTIFFDRQTATSTPSKPFVAKSDVDIKRQALEYYNIRENGFTDVIIHDNFDTLLEATQFGFGGEEIHLVRDQDVLDTWFSSALWPFGTLGWPEQTQDLARHYPNDLLISGFDILFFWNARMAMQGLHFMKDVPWKRMYLHGLVRAEDGSKMSKSKGNVVDPLGLIDQYGADALRFFMAAMESQGRDIKMDDKRVEGYRNFATKLWNASRFCEANGIGASKTLAAPEAKLPVNRWIISEVVETLAALDKALADLRFDAAANTIYHFTWDRFCDWYLELIKPVLQGEDAAAADETRLVAGWVLDQIIVMLHPFMPFITEELWHAMAVEGEARSYDLIVAKWPQPKAAVDAEAKAEIDWLIELVSAIRAARNELNVPPNIKSRMGVDTSDNDLLKKIFRNSPYINKLARVEEVGFQGGVKSIGMGSGDANVFGSIILEEKAAIQIIVQGVTYVIPLAGLIDTDAEKARLNKALEASEKEAASLSGRLSNPNFVEKAKPEAVEKARADLADKQAEAERLKAALARLG